MNNTGVRLQSNGGYWQAAWQVPGQARPNVKSLGSKTKLTKRAAMKKCNELVRQHIINPASVNAEKAPTLKDWCVQYLELRTDLSDKTIEMHQCTIGYLQEHFGSGRVIDSISRADAARWRPWLAKKTSKYATKAGDERGPISEATVCRHVAIAKVIFGKAFRLNMIPFSPFDHETNAAPELEKTWRQFSEDEITTLLSAAPSMEWKALIALCAHAGLRLGEALRLQWTDVDWDRHRLTVRAKDGKVTSKSRGREVLMESPLQSILEEARRSAQTKTTFIAAVGRSGIQRQMNRVVKAAGFDRWSKPFHTLRKHRATSWRSKYPEHIVDAWLGHSLAVARKHYAAVPESFYSNRPSVHQVAAQFAALTANERAAIIAAARNQEQSEGQQIKIA